MTALVCTDFREVTYRDEPDPTLSLGEMLIRADAVGICGSDIAEGSRAPRDLGRGRAAAANIILRSQ